MASRTKGWAQIVHDTSAIEPRSCGLQASTDTSINGSSLATTPTDRDDAVVFLVAGTSYDIRWGGRDNLGAGYGWGTGANTTIARCDVMYELTQTAVASDSITFVTITDNRIDRTFSFTPALTGTYRLKVNQITNVTVGGGLVSRDNTDNGNFGSGVPQLLTGATLLNFTPGLIVVGTTLSSPTKTPSGSLVPYRQPTITVANTFPMGVGSRGTDASETCLLSWRDEAETQFATSTIPATTSASKVDPGLVVNDVNFQAAATAIGLYLTFNNSALSTALSGTGVPWTFISGTLPTGWTLVTGSTGFATTIKAANLYTVDPRVHARAPDGNNGFYFHKNRAAFDTSFHEPSKQMLSPDSGQAAVRVVNALDEGLNGLSVTLTADPVNPGSTVTASSTTAALDGEDGWSGLVDVCPTSKPGGSWVITADITAPTTIDAASYFTNSTDTISVVSADPSLSARFEAGDPENPLDHWRPGKQLVVGAAAVRTTGQPGSITMTRVTIDTDSAVFTVGSLNPALGRLETLNSAGTGFEYTTTPATFLATPSPGDPYLNLYTFTAEQTAEWPERGGFFVEGQVQINGVPMASGGRVESLGEHSLHSVPSSGGGGGGGGGVRLITLNELEKRKKRNKLEDLLDQDISSKEFDTILESLFKKYKDSANGPRELLSEDEEALLLILTALANN